MRRALALALFVIAIAAPAAHAQLAEVYATLNIPHLAHVSTGDVYSNGSFNPQYTNFTPIGINAGLTFNFIPLPLIKVGLDLRGSASKGTPASNSFLAGIKVGVHPPHLRLKPYIQASAGAVLTRTTNVTSISINNLNPIGGKFSNTYGVFEVIGGVDYPLVHFIDFRIVEVAGGRQMLSSGSDNASIFQVNTGLVVHF